MVLLRWCGVKFGSSWYWYGMTFTQAVVTPPPQCNAVQRLWTQCILWMGICQLGSTSMQETASGDSLSSNSIISIAVSIDRTQILQQFKEQAVSMDTSYEFSDLFHFRSSYERFFSGDFFNDCIHIRSKRTQTFRALNLLISLPKAAGKDGEENWCDELATSSFLASARPLPCCLNFALTVYSPCTHLRLKLLGMQVEQKS